MLSSLNTIQPDCRLIRERYEKFLILRLVHVCDFIISETPELAEKTGFTELWCTARRLEPGGLALASQQPLVDAWVSVAERLINLGIFERYPDSHPARHLKAFGRVVLSWAAHLPEHSSGKVCLAGCEVLPLFCGRLLLAAVDSVPRETLSWAVEGRELKIGWKRNDWFFRSSLNRLADSAVSEPGWTTITPPNIGGIIIDAWTPEYHRNYFHLPNSLGAEEQLRKVIDQLNPNAFPVLENLNAVATIRQPPAHGSQPQENSQTVPWIAGLLRISETGLRAQCLVELLCRDLVERTLAMNPLAAVFGPSSAGSDFHSLFVEASARRLARRLLANTSESEGRDTPSPYWDGILARLSQSKAGRSVLELLGEVVVGPESDKSNDVLVFFPRVESESVPLELQFRKTRRDSAFSVNDFSILNAIGKADKTQLEQVLRGISAADCESETESLEIAAAAYLLGRFDLCVKALLCCISFDSNVEEYWHLLAFSLRYLGRRDDFNRIMFEGVRDIQMLRHSAPPRGDAVEWN